MKNNDAFMEFKTQVRTAYPEAEVYVYSHSEASIVAEDSNCDVLVMLDELNPTTFEKIYNIAWEIGLKYATFLLPLLTAKGSHPLSPPNLI